MTAAPLRRGAFHPAILTANDLASGAPLVWTRAATWSRDPGHAHLFEAETGAQAALALAATQGTVIAAPYLVPATPAPDGPRPTAFRERIRLTGPTITSALAPI